MSGRKSFDTLRAAMTPAQQKAVAEKVAALRTEMTLAELRQARQLTQETLSGTLHVGQAAVAKMEKRTDMYVGNLRRFVEAMGGELDVVARFPEGSVKISNFAEIGEDAGAK
ncbi:MAG: Ata-like protein [Sphingomonas bacterium]|nr:Ata-like protein [Sphingomonas bacterium]